jgi:CheY-like chemotaxis protein
MAQPLIDQRRQVLTVLVPQDPVRLQGDPHRLTQVFTNLLTNAAKFTPQGGGIAVTVELSGGEAVLRVGDTGKGIPPEMLPHIFELFTQVNPPIDRTEGGLGLGLTLVRKLVQMHGGQVEAHSAGPGLGSEFVVRLPVHPAEPRWEERAESVPTPIGLRRLGVLVVDDNVDAADTLADLLPIWGHEVRVAYTGPAALATLREWQPEVVLLDIGLPEMDGYAVARQIREIPTLAAVRLLAVTGFGQEEDRQRARDAGFDAHLTKPVDADELRRVLETLPLG